MKSLNQKGESPEAFITFAGALIMVLAVVLIATTHRERHHAMGHHHFVSKAEKVIKLKPIYAPGVTMIVNKIPVKVWKGSYVYKKQDQAGKTIWWDYDFFMPYDNYGVYGNNLPPSGTWAKAPTPPTQEDIEEEATVNVEEDAESVDSDPGDASASDSDASESDSGASDSGSGDSGGGDAGGGDGGGGDGGGGD